MIKVYLAGPIANCTDNECITWREMIKNTWNDKTHRPIYRFLDPMRRDYRKTKIPVELAKQIVENDKHDIQRADVVLLNYFKPSVGTAQECLYAYELAKYVVIVNSSGLNTTYSPDFDHQMISPWLIAHSHRIVETFDEAKQVIEEEFFS